MPGLGGMSSHDHDYDWNTNEPTDWAIALGGTVAAITLLWIALL
jgi:hypothetical protein